MWLLCLVMLAAADVELEEADKRTKMKVCVELTRFKMRQDKEVIDQILETTIFDHKKVIDKIAAEVLLNCYNKIDLNVANELVSSSEIPMTEELMNILTFETKSFEDEKHVLLTKQQKKLIKDIEKDFEAPKPTKANAGKTSSKPADGNEKAQAKDKFANRDMFSFGSWYVPVVLVAAFGLIWLAAKKVLNRSKKVEKQIKAKKTK